MNLLPYLGPRPVQHTFCIMHCVPLTPPPCVVV